jgi:hypothetical protein
MIQVCVLSLIRVEKLPVTRNAEETLQIRKVAMEGWVVDENMDFEKKNPAFLLKKLVSTCTLHVAEDGQK